MSDDFDAKAILTEGGGAAFPMEFKDHTGARHVSFGLTARDYFAGQALMGLLASPASFSVPEGRSLATHFAMNAYQYADAMLLERRKETDDATIGATPPQDSQ